MRGPFNTMLTNVPGTSQDLYFAGAQSIEGFGIGPLVPGVALFHTASSVVVNKKGRMLLSFWACRDTMPNPDVYRNCILEAYAEPRDATLGEDTSDASESSEEAGE